MFNDFDVRPIPLSLPSARAEAEGFLARFGLRLDPLDYYAGVYEGDTLLCAGGFEGAVIKCVAVDESARGLGLTNLLVSHLRALMWERGVRDLFVFTKPGNREIFEGLAFTVVGEAPGAILLESDSRGVRRFCEGLAGSRAPGKNAAIVMNANPFTLGHRYLAEQAAARCDRLHLFVVESEKSRFPFAVRRTLVERGTADLPNVVVHAGGPYIISAATFPSYFLKRLSDAAETHALLDADIFARHIAPALGITLRFVGTEPLDPLTAAYNAALLRVLPPRGIAVEVVERRTADGAPVSASRVRALLDAGRLEELRPIVPETTFAYLKAGRL